MSQLSTRQQHLPTLYNWKHSLGYFPVVPPIRLLYIIGLCIPAKQSFTEHWHFLGRLFCTLKHQSREHNIFLFMKFRILHPLSQTLLQRARIMNSIQRVKSNPKNTAWARLHLMNKLLSFPLPYKTHLLSLIIFRFHYSVLVGKSSCQNFHTTTTNFKGSFKLHRFLLLRAMTLQWESITWVLPTSNACSNW